MKIDNGILSIIVPLRLRSTRAHEPLVRCYKELLQKTPDLVEVIFVDNSEEEISSNLQSLLEDTDIIYIRRDSNIPKGINGKLGNIKEALEQAKGEYIALFDDDVRATEDVVRELVKEFKEHDYLRIMPFYKKANFFDLIDISGVFLMNFASPYKQFWGNICFRKDLLINDFPSFDVLFDELAIELKCRKKSKGFKYLANPPVLMENSFTSLGKFMNQRIRFAYENIVFPMRFVFFLSILPFMFFAGKALAISGAASLSLLTLMSGYLGQKKYGKIYGNKPIWLFSPLWFWFYPFTSWIGLFLYLTGGVNFCHSKIKKVV